MLSPATWLREDKGFRSVDSERLNLKASSRYPATSPASARMVSAPLHESSGEIKDASWNDDLFHHVRGERLQRLVTVSFIPNIEKNKMNTNSSKLWKIHNKNTQKKNYPSKKGTKILQAMVPWLLENHPSFSSQISSPHMHTLLRIRT